MSRYSNDLRKKVINFYQAGNSKSTTARTFGISRPTLDSWISLKEEGKLCNIKEYHHGRISIVNLEDLKKHIDNHPDAYLRELEQVFPLQKSQLANLLRDKLGLTRKKNGTYTRKEISKNKNNL